METPRMSASKDLLNTSQLASLTQGWGLASKPSSESSTLTSAVSLRNSARSGQVSLIEKGSKAPPPPKFSLTSSHGNVTHLFQIDPEVIKHLPSQIDNADRSILVGSISTQGRLVIWDLNSRRPVLEEDSGLENCSWASVVPDQDDLIIFVHSRTEGLFKFNGFPLKNPSSYHSSTRQVAVHPGFCKPDIFDGTKLLAYPCVGNKSPENYCKVLQCDFREEATFPPVEAIVFVIAISFPDGNQNVLCGCETGTLILFDVRSARPVGSTNIHEHNSSKDDKDEVPFCCDYDPLNSSILIGSSHRNLYSFYVPSFQLAKRIVVTNPGTTCVSIRQDGQLAATGGTDSTVRIFSWPDLKALAVLKFHCDVLSTLRFFPTSEGFLLLSCSQDSALAVWDIYSKVKRLEK